ncbi:MAG: bifunctional phosphoribosyl-AMP cyclohydrolase/phosphoribosyl-ATP diphosphatase HisIE [Psychroserpens sp.]|nr:bifunctional phosphoribosyl-AMP cyclohydrolase/phosphoribosyl-ATP diphosphatase HisIE [Psychroserpens sp.]
MDIDYTKHNGLVPAIIQDVKTNKVLMLGYMNEKAYQKTINTKLVTFFSRSKQRLWTKGEESGNVLELIDLKLDCDRDALLVKVNPKGPTCHLGTDTCWDEINIQDFGFLNELEGVIQSRKDTANKETSYVASLFEKGINKIAQKVGEEAVETVIEAKDSNDDLFLEESADLLFHYLILLQAKGFKLQNVVEILQKRHR